MKPITTVRQVQEKLSMLRTAKQSIALVPTMGALHAGHLSLVQKALADNDTCVVSIFVNPTQFNNKQDLEKYPRNLDQDCQLLATLSKDIIVFAPSVDQIYPEPDTRQFDFGSLDKVMEGKFRPGHFNGVAQVVSRLFDIIKPDKAYFGQKDFQQLAIIRSMTKQLKLSVQIIPMPIVREKNGLALSSRNKRLTAEQQLLAVNISTALFVSKEQMDKLSVKQTLEQVTWEINACETLEVEYFEIVDGNSLLPVDNWRDSNYIVGCITVFCGNIRLIDNIIYKGESLQTKKQ